MDIYECPSCKKIMFRPREMYWLYGSYERCGSCFTDMIIIKDCKRLAELSNKAMLRLILVFFQSIKMKG